MKLVALAMCLCTAAYAATPDEDGAVYELSEATNDDFSYTVMLSMLNERNNIVNYCAGARISVEWFLTAAECLNQTNVSKFVLTYTKRTSDYLPIPFELKSVKHQIHPKYDQNTKTNNLALLRCEQCGRQGPKQIPKLPSPNDASTVYSGESAIVTGISKNQATNFQKFDMHFLKTKILSPFWCKLSYFSPYFGTNRICASNWGHQGLSEADVGAPLVLAGGSDGSVKLVGVATSVEFWSTVFPIPMVFTKVAPHVDWIRTVTSAV